MVPIFVPYSEEKNAKNYEQAVEADLSKAERIKQKLLELTDMLTLTPSLWGGVISFGWAHMLEFTDFPVCEDRVLDGGFSPSDWFLSVGNASAELGFSVAQKYWKDSKTEKEKIKQLLKIPSNRTKSPSSDLINQIEKVLRWRDVLERLDETTVKVLAFSWIADKLMVLECISCPEVEVNVQKEVWKLLEKLLEKDKLTLVEMTRNTVSRVKEIKDRIEWKEIDVADWAEIIQLPWG